MWIRQKCFSYATPEEFTQKKSTTRSFNQCLPVQPVHSALADQSVLEKPHGLHIYKWKAAVFHLCTSSFGDESLRT